MFPYNFESLLILINIQSFYRTLFKQEGVIDMIGFGKMSWLFEVFVIKFLTRGAKRNVTIMEELMRERLAAFSANY